MAGNVGREFRPNKSELVAACSSPAVERTESARLRPLTQRRAGRSTLPPVPADRIRPRDSAATRQPAERGPVVRSPADVLRLVVAAGVVVLLLLVEWLFGDALVEFTSDLLRGLDAIPTWLVDVIVVGTRCPRGDRARWRPRAHRAARPMADAPHRDRRRAARRSDRVGDRAAPRRRAWRDPRSASAWTWRPSATHVLPDDGGPRGDSGGAHRRAPWLDRRWRRLPDGRSSSA